MHRHVHRHTCTCTRTHARTHTHAHTHTHTRTHAHTHTHTHTHAHTHTHTHTHKHTHTHWWQLLEHNTLSTTMSSYTWQLELILSRYSAVQYQLGMQRRCGQYSVTNCRCDVAMLRCFHLRSSNIDMSIFEDRCVDFQRLMCRPSEIDVSTFED